MKCNFEHWPSLTRGIYSYGKEINPPSIPAFITAIRMQVFRPMQMLLLLAPLRSSTDEGRRKGKVFVSQQLPLKLLLATNVEGIYFLFRNGPQIAIM